MIMLILVFSLTFQTAFGAEPLASISRPFHLNLPFLNTTTQSSYEHKNNTLQYIFSIKLLNPLEIKTPRSLHKPCQPLEFSKHISQTGPWVPPHYKIIHFKPLHIPPRTAQEIVMNIFLLHPAVATRAALLFFTLARYPPTLQ